MSDKRTEVRADVQGFVSGTLHTGDQLQQPEQLRQSQKDTSKTDQVSQLIVEKLIVDVWNRLSSLQRRKKLDGTAVIPNNRLTGSRVEVGVNSAHSGDGIQHSAYDGEVITEEEIEDCSTASWRGRSKSIALECQQDGFMHVHPISDLSEISSMTVDDHVPYSITDSSMVSQFSFANASSASAAALSADEFSMYMCYKLGGLYTILIIVVGCVLSLATALTHRHDEGSYYLEAYDIFIYSVSLLFLIAVHIMASGANRRRENKDRTKDRVESGMREIDTGNTRRNGDSGKVEATACQKKDLRPNDLPRRLTTALNAPGVNFYLRLGAIGFGTGSMIQDGFRLAEFVEDGPASLVCLGPLHIVVVILHMAFTLLQTFFIFKSHKIAFYRHQTAVRFGFIHLIATNVCVWFAATVSETHQDFLETFGPQWDSQVLHVAPRNESEILHEVNQGNHTVSDSLANCCSRIDNSLSRRAAPYLFPCTIEYSLIAAAVVYKMYRHVRGGWSQRSTAHFHRHHQLHHHTSHDDNTSSSTTSVDCHKANRGLFLGLFVIVLTLVAVCCYFVVDEPFLYGELSSLTFFGTEIALLFLLFVAVVFASVKFQRLQFVPPKNGGQRRLDQSLLIIAAFGVFALECFHLVSAVGNRVAGGMMGVLAGGTSVLAFAQAAAQTLFILDALHRSAATVDDRRSKPGRALVTFLILCNLSLWVVCIFEVKKVENLPIHATFYGYLPWSIISHLCVPLVIFFRFHSTVCLSEIWINAYQLPQHLTPPTATTATAVPERRCQQSYQCVDVMTVDDVVQLRRQDENELHVTPLPDAILAGCPPIEFITAL